MIPTSIVEQSMRLLKNSSSSSSTRLRLQWIIMLSILNISVKEEDIGRVLSLNSHWNESNQWERETQRERERESADAIFRERNRRRPRDSRRRLLYITSLLILDGNASLNGGELRFFSSSDSSAVVGGRWLTFRRGHCRASGRLGVMTSDEIVRVIVYVNDWEFGTQLGNNCNGVA